MKQKGEDPRRKVQGEGSKIQGVRPRGIGQKGEEEGIGFRGAGQAEST
jgi:hypothetical protein